MTLQEIKTAIEQGKRVFIGSTIYEVKRNTRGAYNIVCSLNNSIVGLTWLDGVTLNFNESDAFVSDEG